MKPICVSLVFLVACGSSKPTPANDGALVEGRVKAADGLELVYDARGKGDTTLVFVHCWSCDRTYWKNQVDVFAKDYRVITLDLGGHGQSGDNRAAWTLASLGADVQTVVEKLDAKRVILVGHSMGGPVSLDAASRMPGRVLGVVCADTLHDAEMKMPPALKEQVIKGFETDFAGTMKQGLSFMFRPTSDPKVVEWVSAKTMAAKPTVGVALFRELSNYDMPKGLAAAKVPIRCINAAPAGPMAPKTNIEVNKKFADFDAVVIEDVGHFIQLEKPDEFNAKFRAVLDTWKK